MIGADAPTLGKLGVIVDGSGARREVQLTIKDLIELANTGKDTRNVLRDTIPKQLVPPEAPANVNRLSESIQRMQEAARMRDAARLADDVRRLDPFANGAAPPVNRVADAIRRTQEAARGRDAARFAEDLAKMDPFANRAATSMNRYADSIKRMQQAANPGAGVTATQQSRASSMVSQIQASDPFQKEAKALSDVGHAAEGSHLAVGRMNMALEGLAFEAMGANSKLGSIGTKLLEFGSGGMVTMAALAGLAAIAMAWDKITEGARKAEEEQKAAAASIQGLRAQQTNPILGDVPHQRELLVQRRNDLAEDLALAQQMAMRLSATSNVPGLSGTSNVVGMLGRLIYGDPDKMKRDLSEITRLVQVAENEEKRLKAAANEPTRLAGLDSIKNQLDIDVKREQLRSTINSNPRFLVSDSAKSDLQIQLQMNEANLVAKKQEIDAEFRRVDGAGEVLALTKAEQDAKQKLIGQAEELKRLTDRQARAEADIASQTARAQRLSNSDDLRQRHQARLDMIDIERRQEIKKTGDVTEANLNAEQKIRAERLKTLQEWMSAYGNPALSLVATVGGPAGAQLSNTVTSMMGAAAEGSWAMALAGVSSFASSVFHSGEKAKQAAKEVDQLNRSYEDEIRSLSAMAFGRSDLANTLDGIHRSAQGARETLAALLAAQDKASWNEGQRVRNLADYNKELEKINALEAWAAIKATLSATAQKVHEAAEVESKRKDALQDLNIRMAEALGADKDQIEAMKDRRKNEEELETARKNGATASDLARIAEVQKAEALAKSIAKVRATIDGLTATIDGLKSFKDTLKLSDAFAMTDTERLAEARRQYEDILRQAQAPGEAGQAAAGRLPAAAQALLEWSQKVSSSNGADFIADRNKVLADTDAVIKQFEAQRSVAQKQLDALLEMQRIMQEQEKSRQLFNEILRHSGNHRALGSPDANLDPDVDLGVVAVNTQATAREVSDGFDTLNGKMDDLITVVRNGFEGNNL
jgi:hypothetical protein